MSLFPNRLLLNEKCDNNAIIVQLIPGHASNYCSVLIRLQRSIDLNVYVYYTLYLLALSLYLGFVLFIYFYYPNWNLGTWLFFLQQVSSFVKFLNQSQFVHNDLFPPRSQLGKDRYRER